MDSASPQPVLPAIWIVGAVDHAAAKISHAAVESHPDLLEQCDAEVVPRAGIAHQDLGFTASDQAPDLGVDFPAGTSAAVYLCHTRTSFTWASLTSYVPGKAERMAISSVAMATKRSVSVKTSGFIAKGSLTKPSCDPVATRQL